MKLALGFKSHSGWAVLVVVGESGDNFHVLDRRSVELIEVGEIWAKQPYHAAEELARDEARLVVKKGVESAHRVALRQMQEAVLRANEAEDAIAACAVLVPNPMPDWSTDEILAVHFRMHKAEGVLFPDALCRAAESCELPLVEVREKLLFERAEDSLGMAPDNINDMLMRLGKAIGPPWGKDQKYAALAAMIALRSL